MATRPTTVAPWRAVLAIPLAIGCASATRSAQPPPAPAPLPRANSDFHVEYAAARALEQASLGDSRPYLSLANEKLVLRFHGKTDERSLSSPHFDAMKDASHVALVAVSAVLAHRDAKALRALIDRTREVLPEITAARFGDTEQAARGVVRASLALLETALQRPVTDRELHDFGTQTRRDTTTLLQAACDDLLVRLDAATRELRPLAGDAWPSAVIVIATDHQSRAEEVGTQYFERLFHEQAREGALGESRIVIDESIGPNDGPVQAMASHLYDQHLSSLLFDDPTFLQGDVLGKHAEGTIARLLAKPF